MELVDDGALWEQQALLNEHNDRLAELMDRLQQLAFPTDTVAPKGMATDSSRHLSEQLRYTVVFRASAHGRLTFRPRFWGGGRLPG